MKHQTVLLKLLATAILLAAAGLAPQAYAIDVVNIYKNSCEVYSGVILRVDSRDLSLAQFDGRVVKIPRYEIVGLAIYPVPQLPISSIEQLPTGDPIPYFEFSTYRDGELTPLSVGWPISFSPERIQVLTLDGSDQLVDREKIWKVESKVAPRSMELKRFLRHGVPAYQLRHPLNFETCPAQVTLGSGSKVDIIPQLTFIDPIAIKRFQDDWQKGYKLIQEYEDRQRFYAVPQYYFNRTRLGTWTLLMSRYTNVGARRINFLPLVENEYSDGPFGFQRVLRSGVSPLEWGIHEEPNLQVFYGLRADYVHLEMFFDPQSLLIGKRYEWNKNQLNSVDDRLVEVGGMEFGVAYGNFSLLVASTGGKIAIKAGDTFAKGGFAMTRLGLRYQRNKLRLSLYGGGSDVQLDDDVTEDFLFLKARLETEITEGRRFVLQWIRRSLTPRGDEKSLLQYKSLSQTISIESQWDLDYRWTLFLLPSLELQQAAGTPKNDAEETTNRVWPKLASGITIAF